MNFDVLRQKILEKAIRGELVPQLENEPEAAQIGDSPKEVPFTIPEKWKWLKLGSVFRLKAGKFISSSEIKETGKYPCFGGNGIRGYVDHYNKEGKFPLIGRQGALCGNINIADGRFYATEHAVVADGGELIDSDCAAYFLKQLNLNQYATKTAQPGISVKRISETPFPLPSLEEQRRIVTKINQFFEQIDCAEKAYNELSGPLSERFRQLCLEKAIQGKLVPQLESEPEVAQIGETPENVPFTIPEKWKWVRLGVFVRVISGTSYRP
ncbi:MAG: restriction endonuclease subunit S, partial [Sutterella sp.]|nr:restriction endonuclease subunit S [Sutterella sp.]